MECSPLKTQPMEVSITAVREGTWQGMVTCGGARAAFSSELELLEALAGFLPPDAGEEENQWKRSESAPWSTHSG